MLSVENVTVQYGNETVPALVDFSLELGDGEICCLVGESGSGKTTAIRSILGNLPRGGRVTSGGIRFEGASLLECGTTEWEKIRGNKISMIFQDSGAMMDPIRTVGSQLVEYICEHRPVTKKAAWEMGLEVLAQVRLPAGERIMKSYPFQLSGGMCQRVGIAFAMVFKPKLLLADEPTSALDVITQAQIVRQMMALRDQWGTSILLITHNIALAAYMADQILVMQSGQVVEAGGREDIIKHPSKAYTKTPLAAIPRVGGAYYV